MFWHIFKYRLKRMLREKTLIFWALLFPCILATLFNFAFGGMGEAATFSTIRIGVVEKEAHEIQHLLADLETEGQEVFEVISFTETEAAEQLEAGNISSYLLIDEELELVVQRSGYDQTITKNVLDNFLQASSAIEQIMQYDSQVAQEILLDGVALEKNFVADEKQDNVNIMFVSFYSLIALGAIYGGFFGMKTINEMEGNLSGYGIKHVIAPFHKIKMILPSITVDIFIQTIAMILLVSYMLLLGVDFGPYLFLVYLIAVFGGVIGIVIGALVGISSRLDEARKDNILSAVGFFMAFLAGMVIVNIKHWVQSSAPWLANINPGNLITDGIYSLYYYETTEYYYHNLLMMLIITVVLLVIIGVFVRRRQYDSV